MESGMELQSLLNCAVIIAGAFIIVVSLVMSRNFYRLSSAVRARYQRRARLFFSLYQALMLFFLFGYLGALVAIFMGYPLLSETFVSFIFLFGAIFVLLSVRGQLGLLLEIRKMAGGSNKGDAE